MTKVPSATEVFMALHPLALGRWAEFRRLERSRGAVRLVCWMRWAFFLAILMSQTAFAGAVAPRILRDVTYAEAGGVSLRFDASLPGGESLAPAAIIVHGGAWVRGDRRRNVEPLFQPLAEAGFAWFSISYSLATDPFQVGAAVTDVEAAIRFISSRAAEYNIDAQRIVLVGESAGGQLAAMAALGNRTGVDIKAVVAMYTPTDLVSLVRTSSLVPDGLRQQLNGTLFQRLILARLEQMSPIAGVRKEMPPFLFIHGDADRVVPIAQSIEMCRRMEAAGAACRLFTVPGAGHGLKWWEGSAARSEPYKQEMVRWLRQQLRNGVYSASVR